jgi:hypothetical protein
MFLILMFARTSFRPFTGGEGDLLHRKASPYTKELKAAVADAEKALKLGFDERTCIILT